MSSRGKNSKVIDTETCEVSEIEDIYQEPTIDRVGNVTFIGINHATALSEQHRPSLNVLDVVREADHLLIEGTTTPSPGIKPNINYELLTADDFKDRGKTFDIHMLEEGTVFTALTEKYGLDQRHYLLFDYYRITHGALDSFLEDNDPSDLAEFKDLLITALVEFDMPGSPQLPVEELQAIVRHVVETDVRLLQDGELDTRDELAGAAYQMNNEFLSPIRDYETLYPRIRDFDRTLQGEKAVIIGKNHVPKLLGALERGGMDAPPDWQQFQDGLNKHDKQAFEAFENIVVRGKKEKHWQRKPLR